MSRKITTNKNKKALKKPSRFSDPKSKMLLFFVAFAILGGGYFIYQSYAAPAVIAVPGSQGNDCVMSGGTIVKEVSSLSNKRNANVCEMTTGQTIRPVYFGNSTQKTTNQAQYLDLTRSISPTTGYYAACWNVSTRGATATFSVGHTNLSGAIGNETNHTINTGSNYQSFCDPSPKQAGTTLVTLAVKQGSVRISTVSLESANGPVSPTAIKPIRPGVSFWWPIGGSISATALNADTATRKVFDVDPFDGAYETATALNNLKSKGTLVCYFSAGTAEDWRSDYSSFTALDKAEPLPGWDGEYILDTESENVRNIMRRRMDAMKNKGCDGVEPDNVDGYTNLPSGSRLKGKLDRAASLRYLDFLQIEAHNRGMSVALKNSGGEVTATLPTSGKKVFEAFDWALVEECYQYSDCDDYRPFVTANKAVVIVEYRGREKV